MDPLFFYHCIDAVERSLKRARIRGFTLARGEYGFRWFNSGWFFEYLESRPHRRVPFYWNGRRLKSHDRWEIHTRKGRRGVFMEGRHEMVIADDALIIILDVSDTTFCPDTVFVVGQRKPGALEKLLDGYTAYHRERSRAERTLVVIGGDSQTRPENVAWDDVILKSTLRDEIRLQIEGFFAARDAYARMGIPYRRGFLFAGPPGNGKTTLLRAIASQRPEAFIMMTVRHDTDERQVNEAFDRAAADAPSILCFEDLDSLFKGPATLSHFLNRMDGMFTSDGVLVVATSNHPEQLDVALTDRPSRFDRVWVFGNPGAAERRVYLGRQFGAAFDERLVDWTVDMSMAQLKEVWVSACLDSILAGSERPSLDAAFKATQRLRVQKRELVNEYVSELPVGFRPTANKESAKEG